MKLRTLMIVGSFALLGCTQQRAIKVEMTWECGLDEYVSGAFEMQPVRFRYVADPHYEEIVHGRGLCDQLKTSEKKAVVVECEAWGDYLHGSAGYREISVDGKKTVDVGRRNRAMPVCDAMVAPRFLASLATYRSRSRIPSGAPLSGGHSLGFPT